MRLPHELGALFEEWLRHHEPGKAGHVLSLIRQMRGSGPYADMIRQRYHAACNRLGLNQRDSPLDCNRFVPPRVDSPQFAPFQPPHEKSTSWAAHRTPAPVPHTSLLNACHAPIVK